MTACQLSLSADGMPDVAVRVVKDPVVAFDDYVERVGRRWYGPALADAKRNFGHFDGMRGDLVDALKCFVRNPTLQDVFDKHHNPRGTLTGFLWRLQEVMQEDRSCLHPLLDFEERHQRVFLRRGLLDYCILLLEELEQE